MWENDFSSVTCKKCIFIIRNETDPEAPSQRDPPLFRVNSLCVCLDVCVYSWPPRSRPSSLFSDNSVLDTQMFNHRCSVMLTSCSHFGAHVYQVQVLPSHWKNTPESLLDLVLGVRQGPGPEASTSGGDALTSGGIALIFWPCWPSYPSASFEAANHYWC